MADGTVPLPFLGGQQGYTKLADGSYALNVATAGSGAPASAPVGSPAAATGPGTAVAGRSATKTYQVSGQTTSGTGAASANIEGSNNGGLSFDVIGTIGLTLGTTTTSDSFTSFDRYLLVRMNVTSISGTGASVSLSMGY
jgi:hypothetical protein